MILRILHTADWQIGLSFTCHPDHAGELEGLAGAKKPEGDGMTRHPLHYPPSTS